MNLKSKSFNLVRSSATPRRGLSVLAFNWTKFSNEYSSETTLHGLKELNEAHSRIWKILWAAALVICAIITAYLIAIGILNYLATPVSTTIGVSAMANFEVPLLYCPNKWLNTKKIVDLKLTPDVLAYALSFLCGLSDANNTTLNLQLVFSDAEQPYITPENLTITEGNFNLILQENNFQNAFDLLLAISLDSTALIVESDVKAFLDYNGFQVQKGKEIPAEKVITGSGLCFRVRLPVTENIGDAFKRNKLDLLPTISEQQFSLRFYDQPSYISVESLHGTNDRLYLGDQASTFIPDSMQAMRISDTGLTYRISDIKNYSRVDRKDQPCRDRNIHSGPYFEQECKQECYTRAKRGCQPLGLNVLHETSNLCRFGAPKQPESEAAFLECLASCPIPCQETTVNIATDSNLIGVPTGPDAPSPIPDGQSWPDPECQKLEALSRILDILFSYSCLDRNSRPVSWCVQLISSKGMFLPKPCLDRILSNWNLTNLVIMSWPYTTVAERLQYPTEYGLLSEFLTNQLDVELESDDYALRFLYKYTAYYAANYPISCTWSDLIAIVALVNCDHPETGSTSQNHLNPCTSSLKELLNWNYLTQTCFTEVAKKWTNDSSARVTRKRDVDFGSVNDAEFSAHDKSPDKLRSIIIVVSRTVTTIKESESYTWDTMLGIIGGQLGLWLGGSILSPFQLLYYFSRSCHRRKHASQGM